jgi:hypothetical protein
VLAALCLAFLAAWVGWRIFARTRNRQAQRAAFGELERIRSHEQAGTATAVQRLLRRYALTVFGPDRMASLTGDAWIAFIAQHGGAALSGDVGRSLLGAAFGNATAPGRRESWLTGAEAFIRNAPRHARRGRATRARAKRRA